MTARLRYLVPVDFSAASTRAADFARAFAGRTDAEVVFVHVRAVADLRAAVAEDRGDLLAGDAASLAAGLEAHFAKRLGDLVRDPAREGTKLLVGIPSQEICREAGSGYDLVFAGPQGRGGVVATLLGSTTQALLAGSPVPVVVVPEAPHHQTA